VVSFGVRVISGTKVRKGVGRGKRGSVHAGISGRTVPWNHRRENQRIQRESNGRRTYSEKREKKDGDWLEEEKGWGGRAARRGVVAQYLSGQEKTWVGENGTSIIRNNQIRRRDHRGLLLINTRGGSDWVSAKGRFTQVISSET